MLKKKSRFISIGLYIQPAVALKLAEAMIDLGLANKKGSAL
jgi:hypothetical protein